ncbi:MAG TPA: hypothetical protein VI412_06715 [Tabrizicola sp.]
MKPDQLLALDGPPDAVDRFRKLTFTVAADLAGRWTIAKAQAIALKIADPSDRPANEAIAHRLNITRQAVDARLKSADYPLLEEMIQAFLTDAFTAGDFA